MTLFEFLGYIGAIAIGLSLGLIGGGGSILTVPLLVYLFHVEPILATAYSLFIVGINALLGSIKYARKGLVNFKVGFVFATPAFITVYLTRRFLVPNLPDVWFSFGGITITKGIGVLVLFALLMVAAAISMIKKKVYDKPESNKIKLNIPSIIIEGSVVGVLTGTVGAGGGFLIIPALVLFARLPMKMAIGTSLLIIAVNSLIGFIGDVQVSDHINWMFLLSISALAMAGIFIGTMLSSKVDNAQLKKGFGYFVLVMGIFMIIKELFLL